MEERWLGEIEGIDLTLRLLREQKVTAERICVNSGRAVHLGMPGIAASPALSGQKRP